MHVLNCFVGLLLFWDIAVMNGFVLVKKSKVLRELLLIFLKFCEKAVFWNELGRRKWMKQT